MPPIDITYNNDGNPGTDISDMNNISTTLVDFREGYVQSTITLVVLNSSMNGTIVKCSVANLDLEMVTVFINTSG